LNFFSVCRASTSASTLDFYSFVGTSTRTLTLVFFLIGPSLQLRTLGFFFIFVGSSSRLGTWIFFLFVGSWNLEFLFYRSLRFNFGIGFSFFFFVGRFASNSDFGFLFCRYCTSFSKSDFGIFLLWNFFSFVGTSDSILFCSVSKSDFGNLRYFRFDFGLGFFSFCRASTSASTLDFYSFVGTSTRTLTMEFFFFVGYSLRTSTLEFFLFL